MVGFAVYDMNDDFKDFYVSAVLDYLPEGTDTMSDGEYGNLAAVLRVDQGRVSSFFASQTTISSYSYEDFSPYEESIDTYDIYTDTLTSVTGSSSLIHFNGLVKSDIDRHDEGSTGIPTNRQVRLNSVPHRSLGQNVPLTFAVGEVFWTSFVDLVDYESEYPAIDDFRAFQASV